ncbi:lipid IV(A) 4-amino-4-deoxy-L-arabinosyltransferase [Sodalis sp. dw_96]|uniref:lipid IV(A) 4-amino-4-deoxy-L-arabinosyltransferase n=1 Tax=Sodalis sp. dw_96 TaxID=2719794 RepID=UPI001BD5A277|nr:lipid IV(A) 4-amino-4-deoxy-L-arabinosyltransferase [Sodalis sp. dw_96]
MKPWNSSRALGFGVALYFVLLYLLPLNGRLLWQPDETRYAEISREMLQRGDWVVPHLLGLRYFEKPVAGYWFNNISQWLFGDTNFAVRFGAAFSSGITALLVFALAMMMWRQRRTAWLAALIFLSMTLVFGIGTYNVLDPMIALWLTAAMASFYLAWRSERPGKKLAAYVLLGLACAMGVMTKGFLALAVPVIAVLPIAIRQRRFRELLIYGPAAVIAAVLLCLPWALVIARREPDFWHYFFWVEHIKRFAEANAQHRAPFWYYLPVIMAGSLPWLALLPGSLRKGWIERRARPELFFLLSWVVMPLLFFSIAKGKLPTYILSCMAPLALLMAAYAVDCAAAFRHGVFRLNAAINIVFGALCIAVVVVMGFGLLSPHSLYNRQEWPKIIIGVIAFAGWVLFAALSGRRGGQRFAWAAACPLLLALLVGYVIPQNTVNNKQPQHFIRANADLLNHDGYLLSNNVGVATTLAWELKRSDIEIYRDKGELSYGLAYPDAQGHFVSEADFPDWLSQARRHGNVALLLRLDDDQSYIRNLPDADAVRRQNWLALYFYRQRP